MSLFQLFNGVFFEEDEPLLLTSNRGFCYGDGFFESMRLANGRVLHVSYHWQRIQRTCQFLRIQIPEGFTKDGFQKYAEELSLRNGFRNARIRFQGFRKGKGKYAPDNNSLGWSMVCHELEAPFYQLNKKGLHLGICRRHTINPAPQSSFKSSNSLPYILGGIYGDEMNWDDCFMLDADGFIAEATSSNVFLIKGKQLLTPDLERGGVAGVMRFVVMQSAKANGFEIVTASISEEDLIESDECFLTNAVRGVQWVGAFAKKRYFKKQTEFLLHQINAKYGLV